MSDGKIIVTFTAHVPVDSRNPAATMDISLSEEISKNESIHECYLDLQAQAIDMLIPAINAEIDRASLSLDIDPNPEGFMRRISPIYNYVRTISPETTFPAVEAARIRAENRNLIKITKATIGNPS